MKPFAPIRLRFWPDLAKIGTIAGRKRLEGRWLRGLAGQIWPGVVEVESWADLRRAWSCDHREGSRDLARCTAMILVDPIIDPAASELTDSTCIDRLIGHEC